MPGRDTCNLEARTLPYLDMSTIQKVYGQLPLRLAALLGLSDGYAMHQPGWP